MMVAFAFGRRIDIPKFSVTWISANIYRILLPDGSWQLGAMSNEKTQICFGNGTAINCWAKMVRSSAIRITACSVAVPSSTEACSRFFALVAARPSFASVSTRDSASVGSATLPVYNALGGPQGKGHVSFVRGQSQYLDAGPRTLNIATNGGLTIVAVVRFTGDAESNERIIDLFFRGPPVTNNIMIRRCAKDSKVVFEIRGVSSPKPIDGNASSCQPAVQNDWLTVVVRYRASTKEYWFTVSNNVFTGNSSAAVTDRTLSSTWMARASGGQDFLNGDIAGVFVVDEYLSTDATTAIVNAMVRGEDLTKTSGWTDVPGSGYYNATARTLSGVLLLQCTIAYVQYNDVNKHVEDQRCELPQNALTLHMERL